MQIWDKFLSEQETALGEATVRKWLRPLQVVRFDARNLYLKAADSFQIAWFEEHIRKKVQIKLFNNNNRLIKVHISLDPPPFANAQSSIKKKPSKESVMTIPKFAISFDPIDPHCTFDSYVSQGQPLHHRLLSQLASTNPKEQIELATFNPVYLWGPSGSGKTHLLMAAAHALRAKGLTVVYVKAETFTEHVVTAIRAGEMSLFRQSYRNAQVLIIDDVHLFGKKLATQEELFHTFNTLHLARKQIILSANSSPSELPFMEPRLISRFEWGIVLPMDPVQKEELKQIALNKAKQLDFPLHSLILEFLISNFSSSPKGLCRAIEALILRKHMHPTIAKQSPTQLSVSSVQHLLSDLIQEEKNSALSAEKIVQFTAEYFGITSDDILGKSQNREAVLARQMAMHLSRTQLDLPFTKLGDFFKKDHSTVISSVRQIQKGLDANELRVCEPFRAILKRLKP